VTSSGIKDTHSEYKVKGPGVVTGRSGSIGNVFYVEDKFWPLNTALYIKDFKGNNVKYVYYFLKSFDLSKYSTGTGVPTLNRNFVHDEIVLSTSNIEEQNTITNTLDRLVIESEQVKSFYDKKIISLEELKKSILQKAFAGELTNKEVLV
jgi:type I restriction enzyme S subunit